MDKNYNLRDVGPAGGLIFYINPNAKKDGWKYLEAAPESTESQSTDWIFQKQWGKMRTPVDGTGTAIGTGKKNTALIVAKLKEAPAESDRAAQLCDALRHGGYSDWFLPSKDELNEAYVNLKKPGVGGFKDVDYWSSSEDDSYGAWAQNFYNGHQDSNFKDLTKLFRAVRTF